VSGFKDDQVPVSPVIARALALIAEQGRELAVTAEPEDEALSVDHLADIAHVISGERRVRTHTVLTRFATHNPGEYDGWVFADLSTRLPCTASNPPSRTAS
jgi:S-DNA-T family DNA segregation ATPase FtsK/SpoIIIE